MSSTPATFQDIHTERMILKSVTPAVIHYLFNNLSKEQVMVALGADEEKYQRYLEMHEKGMETHRFSMHIFLLADKETNRIMGECGFHTWNTRHQRAELFYNLHSDADKQKGYMSEALPVVLDFGFNTLGIHRIKALIADSNVASKRLLLKFGFVKEGTMRQDYYIDGKNEDSDCYSLLKQEWNKR